ncbi:TRAF-like protein, partial [Mycena latifolia]
MPSTRLSRPSICQSQDATSRVYTWRLKNWKKLDKKLRSAEFECGGHKWRILLFPLGYSEALNSEAPPNDVVSIYLDYSAPKNPPQGSHASAQFAIMMSNIHDPTLFTISHGRRRFTVEEPDWGFTRFSQLVNLFHRQECHSRPMIEEDAVDITVYVRVLEDQ